MGTLFQNPPLIEALCEFHFQPGESWDWTVPGLFYAHVRNEFPDKREQQAFVFELPPGVPSPPVNNVARVQFVREDKSALIQVGPNLLVVNHLRPYPTWERFRALIARNLAIYREVAEPKSIQRVGLRYINRIEIPRPKDDAPVEIEEYLRAAPGLPDALKAHPIYNFQQRVEFQLPEIRGFLALQSAITASEQEGHLAFILDLDVVTQQATEMPLDEAMDWVEQSHAHVEDAFLSCITPASRRLFGEIDNANPVS